MHTSKGWEELEKIQSTGGGSNQVGVCDEPMENRIAAALAGTYGFSPFAFWEAIRRFNSDCDDVRDDDPALLRKRGCAIVIT